MGYGKKAARNIDHQLMGVDRIHRLLPEFHYDQTAPAQASEARRHLPKPVPAAQRARNFEEAMLALSPEEAHEEACRCLRCDVRELAHH
jgi:hypothetical protein